MFGYDSVYDLEIVDPTETNFQKHFTLSPAGLTYFTGNDTGTHCANNVSDSERVYAA